MQTRTNYLTTGNGILDQIIEPYYQTWTIQDLEKCILNISNNLDNSFVPVMYIGGTLWYGKDCKNLKELRKARESAINNRNNIQEWFNITQRIARDKKHGKNKQIRKHLR